MLLQPCIMGFQPPTSTGDRRISSNSILKIQPNNGGPKRIFLPSFSLRGPILDTAFVWPKHLLPSRELTYPTKNGMLSG